MDSVQIFLDIIKFILPAVVVFFTAYFVLKNQGEMNLARLKLEVLKQNQQTLTPIKLQAYERMTLFLERISPAQLIQTLNQPDLSGKALKYGMLTTVQQEFNYNLSQQIYISPQAWNLIKVVKEQVIKLIHEASAGMPEQATGADLSKMIVDFMMKEGEQPTDKAIKFLKAEVGLMFGQ
jgi:uncharacterized membrane protein